MVEYLPASVLCACCDVTLIAQGLPAISHSCKTQQTTHSVWRDEMSDQWWHVAESFRSAFITSLKSDTSRQNHSWLPALKSDAFGQVSESVLFLLRLLLTCSSTEIYVWGVFKIRSMALCSLARGGTWEPRLTSTGLTPRCPLSPASQLWFIHWKDRHNKTQRQPLEQHAHHWIHSPNTTGSTQTSGRSGPSIVVQGCCAAPN